MHNPTSYMTITARRDGTTNSRRRATIDCMFVDDREGVLADGMMQLLVSLRNTAQSFGEDSQQYHSIRETIQKQLESMRARGLHTQLIAAREEQKLATDSMIQQLEALALQPQ